MLRELLSWLIIALLVFVAPILGRRAMEKLKASTDPRRRVRAYQKTVVSQAILCLFILDIAGSPAAWVRIFRAPVQPGSFSGALAVVLSVGLLIGYSLQFFFMQKKPAYKEAIETQLRALSYLLPQTVEERRWWLILSMAVGIGEELIFRGYLIRFLMPYFSQSIWWAGLIAALIFGLNHAYQGLKGIILTFIFAVLFTVMFVGCGILWLPMAVHAVLDGRFLFVKMPADVVVSDSVIQ